MKFVSSVKKKTCYCFHLYQVFHVFLKMTSLKIDAFFQVISICFLNFQKYFFPEGLFSISVTIKIMFTSEARQNDRKI